MAALRSIRRIDNAAVADALINAYASLEREAEPIRSKRRAILLKNGGSSRVYPLRVRLQPVHNVQDKVLGRLVVLNSEPAISAMLMQLVRGRNLPLTLRLALAGRLGQGEKPSEIRDLQSGKIIRKG